MERRKKMADFPSSEILSRPSKGIVSRRTSEKLLRGGQNAWCPFEWKLRTAQLDSHRKTTMKALNEARLGANANSLHKYFGHLFTMAGMHTLVR